MLSQAWKEAIQQHSIDTWAIKIIAALRAIRRSQVDDRCNVQFFAHHNAKSKRGHIPEFNYNNQILMQQADMASYAQQYYQDLYSRDPMVENNNF